MHYRQLSELGNRYTYEEGGEGVRRGALGQLESLLAIAKIDLENALAKDVTTAGNVRGKAQFFETAFDGKKSQDRAKRVAEARKKVEEITRWLTLQGAVIGRDGKIDWGKSARRVVYDHTLQAQGMTRIRFFGGKLFLDDAKSKPLDTTNMVTHFSGPGKAIYVMSESGNLHVSSHSVGHRHHSSLLAGGDVAGAGELEVKKGVLTWLSNKSGHYQPSVAHLLQVLHQVQKKGVPMTFRLTAIRADGDMSFRSVGEFLHSISLGDEPDYELMKLDAYGPHLTDDVLGLNGWRWRVMGEKAGVYHVANGAMIPHKEVRQWLKSQGKTATTEKQRGYNR